MQRQPPLAGEGRPFVPGDMPDMLDLDHRVRCIGDEAIIHRINNEPDRETLDDRRCKRFGLLKLNAHS